MFKLFKLLVHSRVYIIVNVNHYDIANDSTTIQTKL